MKRQIHFSLAHTRNPGGIQQMHQGQKPDFLRFPSILYGGDYNPEQWVQEEGIAENPVWQDDLRFMRKANVNLVNLGVFSWAALQPAETTFTFEWLDRIIELLTENQIFVCLGTGTAAQPSWLSSVYPDVLPVNEWGQRRKHGGRLNYCPTNPHFLRLSRQLVSHLAQRYGNHPGLLLWHVSNEYGPSCYCESCAARFRIWLQQRYGTLQELNRRWVSTFWSHTYTAWEQIEPPSKLGERSMQGLQLDYQRFLSDMNLESYLGEAAILREFSPQIPITTNFHGLQKSLDYFSWIEHLDIITWDSYPRQNALPATTAFYQDLMRGMKKDQPWLLLEQTPSQVQWHSENGLKRPGVMRLQSYQAIAHGSNAALFFQWRQSRGGEEMYHGAIISHAGHEHTRVFQEVAALGAELHTLEPSLSTTKVRANVALLMSWPNWWTVENQHVPSQQFDYLAELQSYHRALWKRNIPVDIISPDANLNDYTLVLAPLLTMLSEEQGQQIERYVKQGGTFVTSYFSGMVDENNRAWLGGYPGQLRQTLGIWVEEFDPLPSGKANTVVSAQGMDTWKSAYTCDFWCEVVHLEGAHALSTFGEDFYAGCPAVTENQFGEGCAIYIATRPEGAFLDDLFALLQTRLALSVPLQAPEGVEVIERKTERASYLFLLNHTSCVQTIPVFQPMCDILTHQIYQQEVSLPAVGVVILVPLL